MKSIISGLDKNFDSRVRLGIMSALMVNETLDFNSLKELLGTTDGNLSSHIKALEKNGMINIFKRFISNKPNTSFCITESGKETFMKHLGALEQLIKNK